MSDEHPQRPTTDDRDAWKAYWMAQGMPWRTEPEIDEERQRFLSKRRAVGPDIEKGIYPFRDENGSIKIGRADVEWLLATHENGRWRSEWSNVLRSGTVPLAVRRGLDLRGADLHGEDLSRLPLSQLRGSLERDTWYEATVSQRRAAAINLQGADLHHTDLELAVLRSALLQGASLNSSHLEGVTLRDAHLEPLMVGSDPLRVTDMRRAYLSASSTVDGAVMGGVSGVAPRLADIHWGGANLATVDWAHVRILGDEGISRQFRPRTRTVVQRAMRLAEDETAARSNRQLATELRTQGLNEDADRFAYRAQHLQRQVFRRRGQWGRYLGSVLLDLVSGFGYRPRRSFLTYVLVVLGFAAAYFALGGADGKPLSWNEAIVVSMTAFHGRGFFAAVFQPGDLQAAVAAVEAFIGLLIEIVFIATFTQRFFAR